MGRKDEIIIRVKNIQTPPINGILIRWFFLNSFLSYKPYFTAIVFSKKYKIKKTIIVAINIINFYF
tara:strand:+ start:2121 stop:2318 length:198 start_codon:yes stop_codon:yes gene_type:complete